MLVRERNTVEKQHTSSLLSTAGIRGSCSAASWAAEFVSGVGMIAGLLSAGVSVTPCFGGNGRCADVEAFSGSAVCSAGAVDASSVTIASSAVTRAASAAATDFLYLSTMLFICASTCSIGRKYSSTSGSLQRSPFRASA